MKRMFTIVILVVAMVALMSGSALAHPFTDVPATDAELSAAVGNLYTMGITNGYPDGTFRPDAPLLQHQAFVMYQRSPYFGTYNVDFMQNNYDTIDRYTVKLLIPGLDWQGESNWTSPITRGDLARLIYRYFWQ